MRLLLIDNDLDDQYLFGEALSELALDVQFLKANNTQEAVKYLSDSKVDLIFIDIYRYRPHMNAIALLKQIKNNDTYKHIPVIIFTQSIVQKDLNTCLDLGASGILEKPSSISSLAEGLQYHISLLHHYNNP